MPLIRPASSSGRTFGPQQMEDQEHLRGPAADAADRDQLLDDRLVVHVLPLGDVDRARLRSAAARSQRYSTLRAERPAARICGASSASTEAGCERMRGAGGQGDEAIPDRLRRLSRDLVADDRPRQRREGVAAALEPAVGEARDELLHHPVAAREMTAGVVPEVGGGPGGWSAAVVALPKLRPSPRWCRRRSP